MAVDTSKSRQTAAGSSAESLAKKSTIYIGDVLPFSLDHNYCAHTQWSSVCSRNLLHRTWHIPAQWASKLRRSMVIIFAFLVSFYWLQFYTFVCWIESLWRFSKYYFATLRWRDAGIKFCVDTSHSTSRTLGSCLNLVVFSRNCFKFEIRFKLSGEVLRGIRVSLDLAECKRRNPISQWP